MKTLQSMYPDFYTQFAEYQAKVRDHLYADAEHITEVVNYVLEGQGKKIRPLIAALATKALGQDMRMVMPAAFALEMIHCYSLVHDDLPAMDDDDMRRGRPTVHKLFDEAHAILAGDALLTDALYIVTEQKLQLLTTTSSQSLRTLQILTSASGSQGMIAGQSLDMQWSGKKSEPDLETLKRIHELKTGKLFSAAMEIAAVLCDADEETIALFREIGGDIGLSFQMRDDLIDQLEGTGKTPGKDKAYGKLTFLSLMDADSCAKELEKLENSIISKLHSLGDEAEELINLVKWASGRVS